MMKVISGGVMSYKDLKFVLPGICVDRKVDSAPFVDMSNTSP